MWRCGRRSTDRRESAPWRAGRIGSAAANYVSYTWSVPRTNLREGWNLLLCHTGEPVGAGAAPNGSVDFESSGSSTTCWTVVGSGFDFAAGAPNYIAIDMSVVSNNCRLWVEGIFYGGRDKPRVTIGFDIQGSGLSVAQQIMAKFPAALGQIEANRYRLLEWMPDLKWAVSMGLAAGLAIASLSQHSEFLYFQF